MADLEQFNNWLNKKYQIYINGGMNANGTKDKNVSASEFLLFASYKEKILADEISVINALREADKNALEYAKKEIQFKESGEIQNKIEEQYKKTFGVEAPKRARGPKKASEIKLSSNAEIQNLSSSKKDEYSKYESIRDMAKEKLKDFGDLNALKKKGNSKTYEAMVKALEAVSKASKDNMKASLEALEKASETYTKERSGFFKSATGRARLKAAANLTDFVEKSKVAMNYEDEMEQEAAQKEKEAAQKEKEAAKKKKADAIKDRVRRYDEHQMKGLCEQLKEQANGTGGFIANVPDGMDEFTFSLARVVAAQTLRAKVESGELSIIGADRQLQKAVENLGKTEEFKALADAAKNNPKMKQKLANMKPKNLMAECSKKRQATKNVETAKVKKTPAKQKTKTAGM